MMRMVMISLKKYFKMKIADILNKISLETGIKRQRVELGSYQTAEDCFLKIANSFLAWKGVTYDPSEVRGIIKSLISWTYMLNDDLDPKKGILLKGGTGRGKTMLLKIFSEFLKIDEMKFKSNGTQYSLYLEIVHAKKIASDYQENGYSALELYSSIPCLAIDDIGSEIEESNNFGNRINVIESVLDMREGRNLLTFGTTNLNKLSDKYDDRTISRMNSLFNIISVNHKKDYRR